MWNGCAPFRHKAGSRKALRSALGGPRYIRRKNVFASDTTFDASDNPICYEGGIPVFINTKNDTWNMDPNALEKAFQICPDVKLIVVAHLYGTPEKLRRLELLLISMVL